MDERRRLAARLLAEADAVAAEVDQLVDRLPWPHRWVMRAYVWWHRTLNRIAGIAP